MTENEARKAYVKAAQDWIGKNERDGSFKSILDLYNNTKPIPVGYIVKYTDEWCATFVSACGIKAGLTKIVLRECSCPRMITLYKNANRWMENDNYTPKPGDIIMYDWQDNGVGDNQGNPDHVGIVEKVVGNTITIIEGNMNSAVGRRNLTIGAKYIRGYCVPDFGSVGAIEEKTDYKAKVMQRFGFKQATIDYLAKYKYADDLFEKLATKK